MNKWAEINLDAVAHNIKIINNMLSGGSKIMAVVKADAYGHGAEFIARELAECGVDFFGVSCIDEAVQLRRCGISQDILIFGYTEPILENADRLAKYNIAQTIYNLEQAQAISSFGKKIKAHIKIDTGMNRLGLSWTSKNKDYESVDIIKKMRELKNLKFEGIFTHFAVSESLEDISADFTREQFDLFCELVKILEREDIYFKIKHAANSGAAINYQDMHLDYVRCGLILYGLYPAPNMRDIGLVPAMSLKSVITHVHAVKRGESVSYGRSYTAARDIISATLPIGYADGLSRMLSNAGSVLVNGVHAPIIGRVCMDQCVIDLSGCTDVKVGDTAVIIGQGANSAEQIASIMQTINYEVVCLIGKRVPRVYYKNGREAQRVYYISP